MKRRIITLLLATVLVVAMIGAVGCRRNDSSAATDASGTILIGGAMSVTGIQAPIDAPAIEGINVAVAEINANGGVNGKKLEFINMDSKSDAATAAEVGKQLIDQGAVAIITSSDYDFGGPAARAAQEAGIVGISRPHLRLCSAVRCWVTSSSPCLCGTQLWAPQWLNGHI